MKRIEVNAVTGQVSEITFTPAEEAAAIAYAASLPPPPDLSDVDNLGKAIKALALCVAQVGGLTVPQMKAMFKAKWDALP
jgi:hypothetical protein